MMAATSQKMCLESVKLGFQGDLRRVAKILSGSSMRNTVMLGKSIQRLPKARPISCPAAPTTNRELVTR